VNSTKYIGMDVHTATISVAVLDAAGKLIMESVLETKASTILQFMHGLRGDVYITSRVVSTNSSGSACASCTESQHNCRPLG
jgi:hypothetical protein